jgi:hypothetical protein
MISENSKLAQHAYEEGHRIGWDEARIWEAESNSKYRKYKESAHMACLTNPMSHSVWSFLPSATPLAHEITNSQRSLV